MPDIHDIVLENLDKLDWNTLIQNESVPLSFFMEHKKYLDEECKEFLYSHESFPLSDICKIFQKIDTYQKYEKKRIKKYVSSNRNIDILHFLESNPQWIDWSALSANPNAIWILEKNPDKIDCKTLTWNQNSGEILIKHVDKLRNIFEKDYSIKYTLSENPSTVPFLQTYPEFIDWYHFGKNQNPEAISYLEKIPKKYIGPCCQ